MVRPSFEDESYDHEADVSPDVQPSEHGRQNFDLQEARSLFDELMNERKSAKEVSAADILTRIETFKSRERSHEGQLHWFTVAATPRYGRHPPHGHKGRTKRQLETSSSSSVRNASLSSCCRARIICTQSLSDCTCNPGAVLRLIVDVYRKFEAGFHVVRRSNRLWAGLSTDLVIAQVLMRSLKTSGGLTRGHGMSEGQRVIWLLSMPACADMSHAMLELTGDRYSISEQNKDMTKSRQARDMKDNRTLLLVLAERNPFTAHTDLINIMTGVHVESSVNVEKAREVGQSILDSMTRKPAAEYSFQCQVIHQS